MRDPVLESSPDCKRAASVNIDTDVTRLQSCLKPNGVAKYYQMERAARFKTKLPLRSRDSMTSSLTWQVYGPGVGPITMDIAVVH